MAYNTPFSSKTSNFLPFYHTPLEFESGIGYGTAPWSIVQQWIALTRKMKRWKGERGSRRRTGEEEDEEQTTHEEEDEEEDSKD